MHVAEAAHAELEVLQDGTDMHGEVIGTLELLAVEVHDMQLRYLLDVSVVVHFEFAHLLRQELQQVNAS